MEMTLFANIQKHRATGRIMFVDHMRAEAVWNWKNTCWQDLEPKLAVKPSDLGYIGDDLVKMFIPEIPTPLVKVTFQEYVRYGLIVSVLAAAERSAVYIQWITPDANLKVVRASSPLPLWLRLCEFISLADLPEELFPLVVEQLL